MYKFEDAVQAATKYFDGDEIAANVWTNKYALKDSFGNIYEKTPDDMHRRIAKEIARIEKKYPNPLTEDDIFDLFKNFERITLHGSPMAGIGNKNQVVSLSNCFVVGTDSDSYGGILKIDEEQVQIMKRRGGVGHDLSHLRPAKTPVMNSAITSTGVVPFMERYSNSTREVAQDGRRGALMMTIDVRHPDAEQFIDAKMVKGKVTGANVSVKLTDEFMEAAMADKPFKQQFPITGEPKMEVEINAKALWDKIIHNAWKAAEPGVLFWDAVLRESPADCYEGYRTVSTNPCGELPLCPYDSCRLIAMNLFKYVRKPFTPEAYFDFESFAKDAQLTQRIMDDIVDLEIEKIEQIIDKIDKDPEHPDDKRVERRLWEKVIEKAKEGRRTGVGITAEGDMLAALNLTYGYDDAIEFSEKVHRTLAVNAYKSSIRMAKERGSFCVWDLEKEQDNPFINRILAEFTQEEVGAYLRYGRRNIACLTIAPTGSLSILTKTTSGIEPVFLISYKRRVKVNPGDDGVRVDFVDESGDSWMEYNIFHHNFLVWADIVLGMSKDELEVMTDDELEEIIKKSPYHKATANDVDWVQKVKLQGRVQRWVDHSISVTVNLPNDIPEEVVAKIYETGWRTGCKGITVYRDGSRDGVLVNKSDKPKNKGVQYQYAPKRPKELVCEIHHTQAVDPTKGEPKKWIVLIGLIESTQDGMTEMRPYEVFAFAEKSLKLPKSLKLGKLIKAKKGVYNLVTDDGFELMDVKQFFERNEEEALTRSLSTNLRHGTPIQFIYEQLMKSEGTIVSFSKAIARTIKKYVPDGLATDKTCPECEDPEGLVFEEGCLKCKSCGWSKC